MPSAPEDASVSASVDFVSAFASGAAAVVSRIPSCDMGARVPACPGWTAYDVVRHLGNVHAWAATVLETGRSAPEQDDRPPSRRPRAVSRWYAGKAEDLLQVLRHACPEAPCWTFSAGHDTQGFWLRRQTHETWLHLVDLHQSVRRRAPAPASIPAAIAADGVAEVLEVFLPRMHARGRRAALSAPVVLHAHDTGHTWLVAPPRSGSGRGPATRRLAAPREAVSGLDTVTADAADLDLLLWKRLTADDDRVLLDGNRERIQAFLASPLTP